MTMRPFPRRFTLKHLGLILLDVVLCGIIQAQPSNMPNMAPPRETTIEEDRTKDSNQRKMDDSQGAALDQDRVLREGWAQQNSLTGQSLIFFPPVAPALATATESQTGLAYPAELADYAGEPFFMAYGRLRFRRLLHPRLSDRIEQYRANRDRLVEAIQANRTPLQETDLGKLEAEAEAIRTELGLVENGAALEKQRDALKPDQPAALKEYFSLLLAAQYHTGLSLEQRQLLHEIAGDALVGSSAPSAPQPFFLPAGSRIHWPDNLPPEATSRLARFQELRAALKAELRAQVLATPEKLSASARTKRYAALADQQAPRFAGLHTLAEEIRIDLADRPLPGQPAPSALPADLRQRVGQAMERNARFKRTVNRHLKESSQALAPERIKLVAQNKIPQLEVLPPADPQEKPKGDREAALARLQAGNAQLREEYTGLTAELEATRAAVQRHRDTLTTTPAPTVAQLTTQLARAYAEQENWKRFQDYRDAVLAPGLSPAQRRLLFNAAFATLEKQRLETAE